MIIKLGNIEFSDWELHPNPNFEIYYRLVLGIENLSLGHVSVYNIENLWTATFYYKFDYLNDLFQKRFFETPNQCKNAVDQFLIKMCNLNAYW